MVRTDLLDQVPYMRKRDSGQKVEQIVLLLVSPDLVALLLGQVSPLKKISIKFQEESGISLTFTSASSIT